MATQILTRAQAVKVAKAALAEVVGYFGLERTNVVPAEKYFGCTSGERVPPRAADRPVLCALCEEDAEYWTTARLAGDRLDAALEGTGLHREPYSSWAFAIWQD